MFLDKPITGITPVFDLIDSGKEYQQICPEKRAHIFPVSRRISIEAKQ